MPHTPGPWTFEIPENPRLRWCLRAPPGSELTFVGSVFPGDSDTEEGEESRANGYLLAAAPDLLAACEAAIEYFDDDALELLVAAVDKARGEEKPT